VIRLLVGACLLDEDRVRVLLWWRHTGFSVHNQVTVAPGGGRAVETLARYCLRTPVSLTRLSLRAGESTVEYRAGSGHDVAPGETLDALEFLARRNTERVVAWWSSSLFALPSDGSGQTSAQIDRALSYCLVSRFAIG